MKGERRHSQTHRQRGRGEKEQRAKREMQANQAFDLLAAFARSHSPAVLVHKLSKRQREKGERDSGHRVAKERGETFFSLTSLTTDYKQLQVCLTQCLCKCLCVCSSEFVQHACLSASLSRCLSLAACLLERVGPADCNAAAAAAAAAACVSPCVSLSVCVYLRELSVGQLASIDHTGTRVQSRKTYITRRAQASCSALLPLLHSLALPHSLTSLLSACAFPCLASPRLSPLLALVVARNPFLHSSSLSSLAHVSRLGTLRSRSCSCPLRQCGPRSIRTNPQTTEESDTNIESPTNIHSCHHRS